MGRCGRLKLVKHGLQKARRPPEGSRKKIKPPKGGSEKRIGPPEGGP